MKKRLVSFLSIIACLSLVFMMQVNVVSVSAEDYEYSADQFSFYTDPWMENWLSGDLGSVREYDSQYTAGGLVINYEVSEEDYSDMIEKAGALVEFEEAECTSVDNQVVITRNAKCENRNVKFTFTYDLAGNITWTVEIEQTMGELVAKAGLNTLMGMGVVFAVLIFISFVISLFKVFSGIGAGRDADKVNDVQPATEAPAAVVSPGGGSNEEIIAVISAAIAAYEEEMAGSGLPADELVVRSIKKRGFN